MAEQEVKESGGIGHVIGSMFVVLGRDLLGNSEEVASGLRSATI
jgi:hypothetical protein